MKESVKIAIATKNPCKIEGVRRAFSHYFDCVEVVGFPSDSGVPEQPVNEEVLVGARNRISSVKANQGFDYYCAIESGLSNQLGEWSIVNLALIQNSIGRESFGSAAAFPVPKHLVEEIKEKTLGVVLDSLLDQHDLRSSKGGISFLTHDVIDRYNLTEQAFVMALTRFVNNEMWSCME